MAVGVTLNELEIRTLRLVHAGATPAAAADISAQIREALATWQETLWQRYDWPQGRLDETIQLLHGARFYRPEYMDVDRIRQVYACSAGRAQRPMVRGIGAREFAVCDSLTDERKDPPEKYDICAASPSPRGLTTAIEIWPVPLSDAWRIVVRGQMRCPPLFDLTDQCAVDSLVLIHLAASSMLKPVSPQRAAAEFQTAQALLEDALKSARQGQELQLPGTGRPFAC